MKGYKPAEPDSGRLSVTLSPAARAKLEKLAEERQWSLSNAASYLIEEALQRREAN